MSHTRTRCSMVFSLPHITHLASQLRNSVQSIMHHEVLQPTVQSEGGLGNAILHTNSGCLNCLRQFFWLNGYRSAEGGSRLRTGRSVNAGRPSSAALQELACYRTESMLWSLHGSVAMAGLPGNASVHAKHDNDHNANQYFQLHSLQISL
jgi:hypothetical protein